MTRQITLYGKIEAIKMLRDMATERNGATPGLREMKDFVEGQMSENESWGVAQLGGVSHITDALFDQMVRVSSATFDSPTVKVFRAFVEAFEMHAASCFGTPISAQCGFANDVEWKLNTNNVAIPRDLMNRLMAIKWNGNADADADPDYN